MKPLQSSEIRGCWATCLLQIDEDDAIDYGFLEEEIEAFARAGVSGVYSNGTAGEFYTQSREEYIRIGAILARSCEAYGLPYQIGASHPFPQESIELIHIARDLSPAAIQVILPDWFPVNRDAMLRFFEKAAKAAGNVGLILYNPPHAKVKLEPEDFRLLAEQAEGLVGIKTAGGDDGWYRAMEPVFQKLSVFIPGHLYADGVLKGAHGSYSNMACLSPAAAQAWAESLGRDRAAALDLQRRVIRFMTDAIVPYITRQGYPNQACDKFLAAVGGWSRISSRLRWPYSWIPAADIPPIREAVRRQIPEFATAD